MKVFFPVIVVLGSQQQFSQSVAGILRSVGGSMAGTTLEGGGALGVFLVLFAKEEGELGSGR